MKTYEDFFYNLPESEKMIVSSLRRIVTESANFNEKISYNVPYYFRNSRVCFIWPASVKQGPPAGVVLGFCNGHLLSDPYHLLEKEHRKQVYWITFHTVKEIDENRLHEMIYEAVLVDETYSKKVKKGKSV